MSRPPDPGRSGRSGRRNAVSDLRGIARLAVEATRGVTDVVEGMHHSISRLPAPLGPSVGDRAGGLTGLVYRSVRGVTGLVGSGVDAMLLALEPLVGSHLPGPLRENGIAALNGVLGDHLEASHNPLAIGLSLRHRGRALTLRREALAADLGPVTDHPLVLIHGLCMNDLQWDWKGHDHGRALAQACGCTPVYVRYNTGRHVASNGADLSAALDELVRQWPVPVRELTLLGHSMGGLVARSAIHHARQTSAGWVGAVTRVFFLGTPHQGAPMERGGHWIDLAMGTSPYTASLARVGQIRSAGITDLRHGSVTAVGAPLAEGVDRGGRRAGHLPLPEGIRCFAVAASLSRPPVDGEQGAAAVLSSARRWLGDGLVPVRSALGHHKDPALSLAFETGHQWVAYGLGHLELLGSPLVFERLRAWMAEPA